MKDTKYEDLNKTLAAVGKAVFVNFYYDFKDFSISKDELAKKFFRRILGRSQIVKTFESREQGIYLNQGRRRKHYVLLLRANVWIKKQ